MTDSAPANPTDKTLEQTSAGCHAKTAPEHQWLTKLVGDWAFESECDMGPDQPKLKSTGTETVRTLGGLWIVCEGQGEMPGGAVPMSMRMTIGYDPAKRRFVGSWVCSVMTHMFVYEGQLDDNARVLPLNTEGPSFEDPAKTCSYQDVIEVIDDNTRLLRSRMPGPDGEWIEFMRARYTRV